MKSPTRSSPCAFVEPLEARIAPAVAAIDLGDLNGANGFKIKGEARDDFAARVSGIGDFNGDGIDDVVVGAESADSPAEYAGASYVVFGSNAGFQLDLELSALDGANGFKISGEASNDLSGEVSAAGDINGDGLNDLIIGAYWASPNGFRSGATYVVFGSNAGFSANLNLSALNGTNGFKISGEASGDYSGQSVSGAGDINGDGIDDLIIGAFAAKPGNSRSGASYVIFGSNAGFSANLNLSALNGANGFKISGEASSLYSGRSVSGAGDINGDGFDDLIIGAFGSAATGLGTDAGYVVFGGNRAFSPNLDLSTLNGANGFKINLLSAITPGGSGIDDGSVSQAGDLNGDGVDDLIIGVTLGEQNFGASYVVFGNNTGFSANLDVLALNGANGFKIKGEKHGDLLGFSVSDAGDVNGDGIDDIVIGAPFSSAKGLQFGASYVVFGGKRVFAADLDLSTLNGINGFKIESAMAPGEGLGAWVSGAGDVNDDGIDDLIIGAPDANAGAGTSYVIFGAAGVQINSSTVVLVEADGDTVTIKLVGGNLSPQDITRDPDGNIGTIDLTHLASTAQAVGGKPINLKVSAKTPGGGTGDGFAKVGMLNATGLGLGKVKLQGDLGQILAGDGSGKAAVKSLSIFGNLGAANGSPQLSRLVGAMNKLAVGGSLQRDSVQIDGKVKVVAIGGDLVPGPGLGPAPLAEIARSGIDAFVQQGNPTPTAILLAESIGAMRIGGSFKGGGIVTTKDLGSLSVLKDFQGGLFSEGEIKHVKVLGKMTSSDPEAPVTLTSRNKLDSLFIRGDVENALILAGYNKDELPVNADAQIGRVVVKGNWIASSLVAGIDDSTADGFGRNDTVISGTNTPSLTSSIASVIIKGTATGSTTSNDHFGITAQHVGRLSIAGTNVTLAKATLDDIVLDEANGDFRVVEIA